MDLREQIDAYIEKYKFEIVSRTCDFVKIPSVSTSDDSGRPYGLECARALDFCDALCREKGLFTKNYDYYCLEASCEKEQKGKRLVLVTHADVVPVGEDTIYEPFAGTVYGDYILGRGCVDDKGPLIATLYALAFFKENHIPLKNDIRLVFGSNEERTMDDIEYYLERAGQPDWALAADGDFPAENGEMGRIDFTVSAPKATWVIHPYLCKMLMPPRAKCSASRTAQGTGSSSTTSAPLSKAMRALCAGESSAPCPRWVKQPDITHSTQSACVRCLACCK